MFASALLVGCTTAAGPAARDDWPHYGQHVGGQRFPESAQHTGSNGIGPAPSWAGKSGFVVPGQARLRISGSVRAVSTLCHGLAPIYAPGGRGPWPPGSTGPRGEGKSDHRRTGVTPMQRDGKLGRGLSLCGIGHRSTPRPDSARPGDNPDTSPLIALDPAGGAWCWHARPVAHDRCRRDVATSPALLDLRHAGQTIVAVAEVNPPGRVGVQDGIGGRWFLNSEAVVSQQSKFRPPPQPEASAWRMWSAVDQRHGRRIRWQAKTAETLVGRALATAARHLARRRLAVRCGRRRGQRGLRLQARECAARVWVDAMRSAPPRWRNTGWALALLVALALCGTPQASVAGTMTRASLEPLFPAPLMVGDKSPALAAWPIFRREADGPQLVGHVFETVDLEPTAGYGGKPINLLVAIDVQGNYLDVRLLSQREPIFQSEKGQAQLAAFAAQYKGLSVHHDVQVGSAKAATLRTDRRAVVHGVTAGTVSALAIDRSIMQSASRVALARLDDPLGANVRAAPSAVRGERFVPNGWNELSKAGLVRRIERSNRELENRFTGTAGAGRDAVAMLQPQGVAIDVWVGLASLPQVGRNLLDAPTWERVRALRDSGELVFVIFESGRLALGGPALRAVLHQGERRIELRALDGPPPGLRLAPPRTQGGTPAPARLWRSVGAQPLDATQTLALELQAGRDDGGAAPQRTEASFTQAYGLAELRAWVPEPAPSAWASLKPAVAQRATELTVLVLGLALLVVLLVRQRWVAANTRRLRLVRVAYLVFTLGFIGYVAQGQLTIVTLTSLIEALVTGQGLAFLLTDPVTVLLWAFVLVTLVVWGRGSFCGWLCPFGAMQELLSLAAQRLRFKPVRLRRRLDAGLKGVKYGVLAVLVSGAGLSAAWTEGAVEIEPFKTAISLGFDRAWPFVAWALCCAFLSVFVFRGYCRYVCPLGAALALLGRARLFAWIPRRTECGTPCQSCRHHCHYEAIAPSGTVDYTECFQCLDCVEIYADDKRCLPLVVERKQSAARRIPILPADPS